MFQTSKDYYDFFQRVLESLIGGGSVAKAIKTLKREGFEIRRRVYLQCFSQFTDETGRQRTCQWNPQTIFIRPINDEYEDFEYGYHPSKKELMELLEEVVFRSSLNAGIDLDVEADVF